jgi:hypothetical protein
LSIASIRFVRSIFRTGLQSPSSSTPRRVPKRLGMRAAIALRSIDTP